MNKTTAQKMGGSMECSSLKDKGPMRPSQGRDGQVGPPRENQCAVLQVSSSNSWCGGWAKENSATVCGGWEKQKCSGSLSHSQNWVDRWRRGKEERTCAASTSTRAASSVLSKTPLFAYTCSSLWPRLANSTGF